MRIRNPSVTRGKSLVCKHLRLGATAQWDLVPHLCHTSGRPKPPLSASKPSRRPKPDGSSGAHRARVFRSAVSASASADSGSGKPGRQSRYNPSLIEQLRPLCEKGGTNAELAMSLGIGERTFDAWLARHAELRTSVEIWKGTANAAVERALFTKAVGFKRKMEKPFLSKAGDVVVAKYHEHVPPETLAQIFFLKNRMSDTYADRFDHNFQISSPDDLRLARERLQRAEAEGETAPPINTAELRRHFLLEYRPLLRGEGPIPDEVRFNNGDDSQ